MTRFAERLIVSSWGALLLALLLWLRAPMHVVGSPATHNEHLPGDTAVKGTFFQGQLFLEEASFDSKTKEWSNQLISLGLEDDSKHVYFKTGVMAMERSGTELWVLCLNGAGGLVVSSLHSGTEKFEDVGPPVPSAQDRLVTLLVNYGSPIVIFQHGFYGLAADHKSWNHVPLQGELRRGVQVSTAPTVGGSVYLGYNRGEWGGGLQKIDLATGAVTNIEGQSDTSPEALLNIASDPVTGAIADPQNKACVLVSVGLAHLSSTHGGILRICDTQVTPLWQKSVTRYFNFKQWTDTEPIFGLAPAGTDGSFWAISMDTLYRFAPDGSYQKKYSLPKLHEHSGIYLSRDLPGAIVVRTGVNMSVSTSGYTPLIVPMESINAIN